MSGKLKLGVLPDHRPVRLSVEFPAETHRLLQAYAAAMQKETGEAVEPARLVAPMVARFIASDRAFTRKRTA